MGKNLHMDVDVGARNIIKGKKNVYFMLLFFYVKILIGKLKNCEDHQSQFMCKIFLCIFMLE